MKEIKIPELAESIMEGTIAEWLIKEGEKVEQGEAVIELETDKVNIEVQSEYTGVITEIHKDAGEDVVVGEVVGKIDENAEEGDSTPTEEVDEVQEEEAAESQEQEEAPSSEPETDLREVIASPATRKRARELNIDLSEISPSDPLGRIRPEDVEAAAQPETKQEPAAQEDDVEEFAKPVERIRMSRRRMTIAERLVDAQHTAAMLTTFNEVDMTKIMDLRSKRRDQFEEKHGVGLGFMSFFTKAVVGALKEFPFLNAEIQGNEIVKKNFYDIGIAVSAEDGLVVPVVRDVDQLNFAGIEQEIIDLATKAQNNELALEDLQGGTFTITNGGVFGSMLSTPILNAPQVGILGMHNIQKRAMVMPDDSIEVRPMMYIALSYDHRIVDGKDAVQFLVRLKELLEDPYDLLLEG